MKSLAEHLGVVDPRDRDPEAKPLPALTELTGVDFCEGVLNSREYRESILRRILLDDLPPAVELRLMDMGWGKPVDRVEHTGKDGQPIETVTEIRNVIVRAERPFEEDEERPAVVTH